MKTTPLAYYACVGHVPDTMMDAESVYLSTAPESEHSAIQAARRSIWEQEINDEDADAESKSPYPGDDDGETPVIVAILKSSAPIEWV